MTNAVELTWHGGEDIPADHVHFSNLPCPKNMGWKIMITWVKLVVNDIFLETRSMKQSAEAMGQSIQLTISQVKLLFALRSLPARLSGLALDLRFDQTCPHSFVPSSNGTL